MHRRPDQSTWGDFGHDDQLGRVNLLDADAVRRGVDEVQEGRTFCLSLPLDYPGGSVLHSRRRPPKLEPVLAEDGRPRYNWAAEDRSKTDVVCDDRVALDTQYSTQWDGLAHVGSRGHFDQARPADAYYYNGFRSEVDIQLRADASDGSVRSCAKKLGVEHMAVHGMQGRAVMLDLFRHFGRDRVFVGYHELMRCMRANEVHVERGDMLCLYTGFADLLLEMGKRPSERVVRNSCAVLDGRDPELTRWIRESGVATISADNSAVEGLPSRPMEKGEMGAAFPLHEACLFKLGVPLGELWYFEELNAWLRKNGRFRFLLTAPPLRLTGAIASPVTPIATV